MPGGRPKAVIDYPLVEKLGQIPMHTGRNSEHSQYFCKNVTKRRRVLSHL